MPDDFQSYDERQRQHRFWGAAALSTAAAALFVPSVRRTLGSAVVRAAEWAGQYHLAEAGRHRAAVQAAELGHLFGRQLPQSAQRAAGAGAARTLLEAEYGQLGMAAERARAAAATVVDHAGFREALFGRATDPFFQSDRISQFLEEQAAYRQLRQPQLTLNRGREEERGLLERVIQTARQAAPDENDLLNDPAYRGVRDQLRGHAREEIRRRGSAAPTFGERVAGAFGIRPVTLGEHGDRELLRQWGQHGDPADVRRLKVGALYEVNGRQVDLRGAAEGWRRTRDWMRSNLQVPLLPGKEGIKPLQLFPWRLGKIDRAFGMLPGYSRDPALRSILGAEGETVGGDLFQFGERFSQVDWEDGSTRLLDAEGTLRSAHYGFMRRRTHAVLAAQEARATRPHNPLQWLGLDWQTLRQSGPGAILAKFHPDSQWAPTTFRRILRGEGTAADLRRVAHYFTANSLDEQLEPFIGQLGASLFDQKLTGYVGRLHDNTAVTSFFEEAATRMQHGGGSTFASPELNRLVAQYQANPSAVLNRTVPVERHSFFGFNMVPGIVFGHGEDRRGIDLMRRAITAEVEERLAMRHGDAFLGEQIAARAEEWKIPAHQLGERVADQVDFFRLKLPIVGEVGPAQAAIDYRQRVTTEGLAYAQSQRVLRMLRSGDPEAVTQWLQSDEAARAPFAAGMKQRAHWWHGFDPKDTESLGTQELFLPNGVGFIAEFNRKTKAGASFKEAILQTVTGRWGRQYGAFFTGNPADVTEKSLALEHLPRALNDRLTGLGLGVPDRDLQSGGSIMAGLLLRRVAPAVGAVELWRYTDHWLHEHHQDGPSDLYANARSRAGRLRARLTGGNLLGLGRRELFPGLEKILPERDLEAEVEHQKSGYEAVRKGRFWLDGSRTEFWGEKIDYFLPSAVRVARSHWQEAENADLNTHDYWRHSWIPNPDNWFLGPLANLLPSDRYWWERKHSEGPNADRPYTVTGPMFDPNTLHGPLLNATVGAVLKPRRALHPEYLPEKRGGTASQESLTALNRAQKEGYDLRGAALLVAGGEGGGAGGGGGGGIGGGGTAGGTGGPGIGTGPANYPVGSPGVLLPDSDAAGSIATMTAGGTLRLKAPPAGMSAETWDSLGNSSVQRPGHAPRLSHAEIAHLNRRAKAGVGGLTTLSGRDALETDQNNWAADADLVDFQSGARVGAKNLSDLWGLYGWMGRSALKGATGVQLQGPVNEIDTPSRAYGWARRWYDLNLGGMGGELNELGRRFLPSPGRGNRYNPVPNMMPGWMPGPEYMVDYRHGDPYTAVPRGEIRLPGEAYERTHDVALMRTRASSLGKSTGELMQEMLFLQKPMSKYGEQATEAGTRMHQALQQAWKRAGILISAERRVENKELGISGHYDAILATQGGPLLVDIKTVNEKRYKEAQQAPFEEHQTQVNFYMRETGIRNAALIYVNRDQPDQFFFSPLKYEPKRVDAAIGRVQQARRNLMGLVQQGTLTRGDLYDPLSRLEILGDVAPYSDQYAAVRQYVSSQKADEQLSETDERRFAAVKERVAQVKKRLSIYPYRFTDPELVNNAGTVEAILSPTKLKIRGQAAPIRLAGLSTSQERVEAALGTPPEGMSTAEYMFTRYGVKVGGRVRFLTEADPLKAGGRDVHGSRSAVLFAAGHNVNLSLIKSGAAEERENDYSDTGVAARFTPKEIAIGREWEGIAHSDSAINTKLMKVRSPLEQLERGIVYGKDTGGWEHPFRDYVWPTVSSYAIHSPWVPGFALGAFAQNFVSGSKAKAAAAVGGAAVGIVTSAVARLAVHRRGEVWKPARTRRREELEQYWDTLKYVKYRNLAAQEEALARSEEGVDLDRMLRDFAAEGRGRKDERARKSQEKQELLRNGSPEEKAAWLPGLTEELDHLRGNLASLKLGPHATRALELRELYKNTLYGFDPEFGSYKSLYAAFPKYKRELLDGFIQGSNPKERARIFSLLPGHEQRVLGRYMGISPAKIPERPLLSDYFREHPLPNTEWVGWDPRVDLEGLRQLAIVNEKLDPMESLIYPQQIEQAQTAYHDVPIPTLHGSTAHLKEKLNDLLSGRGLSHVQVEVTESPAETDDTQLMLELRARREQDLATALQAG
jgi:hypothetical protein